jgi:cellulose synthase/poly-beta-1,6-N-acetylglucosamine synthase-like glycosyltransferase
MRASVLVPTWRRPDHLRRCLEGLAAQRRLPDEIVVVARDDDVATWSLLEQLAPGTPALRSVNVSVAGVSASLNAGLDAVEGDFVAITDDDAIPRPDWLERIERHLEEDPRRGGVGGRDWLHRGQRVIAGQRRTVGKVRAYGRVIGNHHLGAGGPREVDVLKGANMAFRAAALRGVRLEACFRGSGMQLHWEIALCLAVKRAGWRLLYDPDVAVDHYPAPRFDEDQRTGRPLIALQNEVYNETWALLRWLPWWRKLVVLAYGLFVGSRLAPGLLIALERSLRRRREPGAFAVSTRARVQAAAALLRGG